MRGDEDIIADRGVMAEWLPLQSMKLHPIRTNG